MMFPGTQRLVREIRGEILGLSPEMLAASSSRKCGDQANIPVEVQNHWIRFADERRKAILGVDLLL